ncbi:UAA transporter family-domain-containing protein [Aspergillus coremiiformis]|uniref:UAA transporter family-domain-containing protein n=1 Tax=Aspergillus coremiiformis TaxID=138285 RepID=A0A5N6YXK8_9EURO|nr:UAA transporter family-domain-containing protein [Aspergillus coremiiformis]
MFNQDVGTLKDKRSQKVTSPCAIVEGHQRKTDGNPFEHDTPKESHASLASITTAATYSALPGWTSITLMISLIFGGCCANVFALEAIIKDQPSSGPLITFAQFILTALLTSPSVLSLSAGTQSLFLSQRAIPLRSWLVYTAFFVTVNLLNNWAFAYKISVPLHIIVRSGGPVASMVVGYTFNAKKYSHGQVLAVAMLTMGVVAAALADARTKSHEMDMGYQRRDAPMGGTLIGFSVLALAMVLSAFQGIYADRLYESYGRNHWKEALFYSHTLSLPLFIPTYSHLWTQWRGLVSSPSLLSRISAIATRNETSLSSPMASGAKLVAASRTPFGESIAMSIISMTTHLLTALEHFKPFRFILACIPMQVLYLLVNAFTQYLCIRGVHLLSAKTSSLTVTIVLNIRKLISLLLSIYLFGNDLASGVLIGALVVFVGGALYGFEGARLRKTSIKRD